MLWQNGIKSASLYTFLYTPKWFKNKAKMSLPTSLMFRKRLWDPGISDSFVTTEVSVDKISAFRDKYGVPNSYIDCYEICIAYLDELFILHTKNNKCPSVITDSMVFINYNFRIDKDFYKMSKYCRRLILYKELDKYVDHAQKHEVMSIDMGIIAKYVSAWEVYIIKGMLIQSLRH